MDYNQLKNAITETIKTNGVGGITGAILQARLLEIVTAIIEEAANISSKQSAISGLSQTSWDNVQGEAAKVSGKQETLVSGINIKKINGQSILGEGNLEIIGGGDGDVIIQTIQSDWNETDSSSGAFIQNKPTIPAAVTETTVRNWGFTKNSGTYSKPSSGIPKTDLASAVQTSLDNADTALINAATALNTANGLVSSKQDKIDGLTDGTFVTIKSNAENALNYAASALNTTDSLASRKQDVITDLGDIRNNASLGVMAYNTLDDYNLQEIQEGASAGAIANGWGDHSKAGYAKLDSSPSFTGDVTARTFFESSDETLKDFGKDIEVEFEKIKNLPKKYFTWKSGGDKQIGTSAQEVQKLYPEIVGKREDGTLTVDYGKLSVIALKAVDKLYEQNKNLEARISRLEALILK